MAAGRTVTVSSTDVKLAITATAAIALLSSCSGGSPTPAIPSAAQENQPHNGKHKATSSCPCVYVANLTGDSITVYPVGTTGDAKPVQYLRGSHTGLSNPYAVAVDSSGNIYVANGVGGSVYTGTVTVYAAGATGNVAPTAVIEGPETGLYGPEGIALDPVNGDIYVTNAGGGPSGNGSITIYTPGSSGDVAPAATIAGSSTYLYAPVGLTLDPSGNVYVANLANYITVYAAGSSGNAAPAAVIDGSYTGLTIPYDVALDSSSNIYVANSANAYGPYHLTVYAAGSNGDTPPSRLIAGKKTKLDQPLGVALDASGNTYTTDDRTNSLTVYAAGANGDAKPTMTIKGAATRLKSPVGIAVR
jgi:hypothetical protein